MIVSCLKELQEINETIRKLHQEAYSSIDKNNGIWTLDTCRLNGCSKCISDTNGTKSCTADRCYHNPKSWEGSRVPYMNYFDGTSENIDTPINSMSLPILPLPENVDVLIKIESHTNNKEKHIKTVKVVKETENCYELENGDFVYKRTGIRRSSLGKGSRNNQITIKYYPPTELDELQDCPSCGKSIFFPFEILKKPGTAKFTPIAKICPHCGFEIPIRG